MSKSYLPVPVFHDDHLSHSFKQANDSFRQRQRPPKLYPKNNHHHHHLQQQIHAVSLASTPRPNNSAVSPTSPAVACGPHDHSACNQSMLSTSAASFATSVSFVGGGGHASSPRSPASPSFGGSADSALFVRQRPLSSRHYNPARAETYFDQCFVVLALLGEGSFSEVFRVRSLDDGRQYAVKRSKHPYKSERYREERLEEVRRYEQLAQTEHCLRLHFAWEQDDHLYMQLELCRESVDAFVMRQERALTEEQIWPILADLLLGIKALHDRDLIHLDVKLENIMMDERGVCKLGDFGLVVDLNAPNLHQASEGDSRYIAPELMQSRFTKAADVFSFGITALELACNLALPNNGPLWVQLRNGQWPSCLDACSPDMQRLIRAAMAPGHGDRPNVDELLGWLPIERILRLRRRWRPLRRVVVDLPCRLADCLQSSAYFLRSTLLALTVRLMAVFHVSAILSRQAAEGERLPNTPQRPPGNPSGLPTFGTPAAVFSASVSAEPFTPTPVNLSLQQLMAMRSATTSTPSRRDDRPHSAFHALAHIDRTPDHNRSQSSTNSLLLLDDSEIEGSPQRPRSRSGRCADASGCGTPAAAVSMFAMCTKSTPLTTHALNGQRKSRSILNDSNHNHSAYMDGTSPLRSCASFASSLGAGTPGESAGKSIGTKRKKLFCNNPDDSD